MGRSRLKRVYGHMRTAKAQISITSVDTIERIKEEQIQSNLAGSDTDGSFTMANSNSFLSPYEILPVAQENKYLGKFSYFIMKLYVVCIH